MKKIVFTLAFANAATVLSYYSRNFIEGQLYTVDCALDTDDPCQAQCEESFSEDCAVDPDYSEEESLCRLLPKPLLEDKMAKVDSNCLFHVRSDFGEDAKVPVKAFTGIPANATGGMTSIVFTLQGHKLGTWQELTDLTLALELHTPLWANAEPVELLDPLPATLYRAKLSGGNKNGLCDMEANAASMDVDFEVEEDSNTIRAILDWSTVFSYQLEDDTFFVPDATDFCINIKWPEDWNGIWLTNPVGIQFRSMSANNFRVRGGSTAEVFPATTDPELDCRSCLSAGHFHCEFDKELPKYDLFFNPDPISLYPNWDTLRSTATERGTVAYFDAKARCVPNHDSCDGKLVVDCGRV